MLEAKQVRTMLPRAERMGAQQEYRVEFAHQPLHWQIGECIEQRTPDDFVPVAPAVHLHEPVPVQHAHIGVHHEDADIDEVGDGARK